MNNFKNLFLLHLVLLIYSLGSVVSKYASKEVFMSPVFVLLYIIVVGILFLYAIVWQQLLKRLPLVTAYANKAITVVWGIVWGILFFEEKISVEKLIGAIIIIIGVYVVVTSDDEVKE